MRLHTIAAAATCALLLSMHQAPAEAAGAKSRTSGSARAASTRSEVSVGKASRADKSASIRAASGKSKSTVKMKGVRTVALAAASLPATARGAVPEVPLTLAQLDVARLVQTGVVHCEMGQSVVVEPQAYRAGAFNVRFGGAVYDMVPEETSTGAVRLSDARAGVVWLQIPVKSMLMDARQGRRMVDACATPFQRSAQALASARSAQTSLSATGEGLGIAPTAMVPVAGNAGDMPVAPAAVQSGSVPITITNSIATPGTPLAPASDQGAGSNASTSDGSATLSASPSVIGGSPGANGTSGAGSAGDPNLLTTPPGATAAGAPSPARASEGAPAGLPLPSRPQPTPN